MDSEDEEEPNLDGDSIFTLEHQLRDFFAENIDTIPINGRYLRSYEDEEGQEGVEYQTATGRIDILAVDDNDAFYVIDFKRDRASIKLWAKLPDIWVASSTPSRGEER